MGDIDKARMAREARDTVGAELPTTGENRVQAAMRLYLGAAAFRSQGKEDDDGGKHDKPRPKAEPKG